MEDDREELLQYTDDESLSDPEEHCCPVDQPEDRYLFPLTFFPHTKVEFFVTLGLLVASNLMLLIVLPLYINAINVRGNVYSIIVFNFPLSAIIFSVMFIIMKFLCSKFRNRRILSLPISYWQLLQLACIYVCSGYLYLYGSDRNRVLCHLQDPMKGIILVFSLLYYFFFCRNLMGLHRIFSTTTVIVGLFIAVDYGLCDEFVCRGYDREQVSDDAGNWSWRTHSIWTGLYILSLTLFAAFFTLLDRYVAPEYEAMPSHIIPTFLKTISRSVASTSTGEAEAQEHGRLIQNDAPPRKSALHFAFWIHFFVLGIMAVTFWVDFIPGMGKGDSVKESFNFTLHGLMCHFENQENHTYNFDSCHHAMWYSVLFQIAYLTFAISSVKFLMLSQSAVFTIAVMSLALPLVGLWWSLFYAAPTGILVWSPKIRGEFVCSIIGLPIVSIGLGLLCKAHFEDLHRPRSMISRPLSS